MPREKEAYRDNLLRLDKRFPDKEVLNQNEVARFLGIDTRTVKKYYPIKKGVGISKATLARCMS